MSDWGEQEFEVIDERQGPFTMDAQLVQRWIGKLTPEAFKVYVYLAFCHDQDHAIDWMETGLTGQQLFRAKAELLRVGLMIIQRDEDTDYYGLGRGKEEEYAASQKD